MLGAQASQPAIPQLTGPVIDELQLLSPSEKQNLESYIRAQQNIAQLEVWITRSLGGNDIAPVAYAAVQKWKLGTEKRDNGILLLVAPNEKRMRIEVGRGLEGNVPDILAGRIVDQILRPAFRQNHFYEGIRLALEKIVALASGDKAALAASPETDPNSGNGISGIFFFLLIFFVFIFMARRRRGIFWGGSGWGGGGWSGGGGGFGGGGGWSGGGGSFGGGGASGSW